MIRCISSKNKHLIMIPNGHYMSGGSNGLLRRVFETRPIAEVLLERLIENNIIHGNGSTVIALPDKWRVPPSLEDNRIIKYNENDIIWPSEPHRFRENGRDVISNGRFVTHLDRGLFNSMIRKMDQDIVAVNVDPQLSSYRENITMTSNGDIAGIRRIYSNSVLPELLVNDWPHHLFIKPGVLEQLFPDGIMPWEFSVFEGCCRNASLSWQYLRVAGGMLDMEREQDILALLMISQFNFPSHLKVINGNGYCDKKYQHDGTIADDVRVFGSVLVGDNVHIGSNVIVIGPTVLGDNVTIGKSTTIKNSLIASNVMVPKNVVLKTRVIFESKIEFKSKTCCDINRSFVNTSRANGNFQVWPWFSYARFFKRIADVIFALIILFVFSPILLVIALIIKLTSSGPIFFGHRREGLHGEVFSCLKFRTMIPEADKIQNILKSKNQVDGPQFKVSDDPRITTIGKFLRETYIDEIPQFINVLFGQMSVVGPRPSPRSENSLCPCWREARLSVRPGITGLWQIRRTRQPGHDFQEWIYYDTKYVKDISLGLDLRICWQTLKKLLVSFVSQFQVIIMGSNTEKR